MNNPSLDIIVTAYNNGDHLDECLQSIAQQTHSDFRVLIIDNASQDATPEIAKKWTRLDHRFNFHQNEENIGHIRSANRAYKMTSSEYVLQLHADDLLKPEFIKKVLLEGLAQHPECPYAYSLFSRLVDGVDTEDIQQFVPDLETGKHQIIDFLCFTNWIIQSFAIFRRAQFDRVGGFERHIDRFRSNDAESPRGGFLDHYMWIRLSTLGPAYVVNDRLGLYREHNSSLSKVQLGQKRFIQEAIRTYDFIYDDHDLFDDITRYLAKVNQVGRLLTDNGLSKTAVDILKSSETGPEIAPMRKAFLEALLTSLRNYVFDSVEYRHHVLFEMPNNLAILEKFIATLPDDPGVIQSSYRH